MSSADATPPPAHTECRYGVASGDGPGRVTEGHSDGSTDASTDPTPPGTLVVLTTRSPLFQGRQTYTPNYPSSSSPSSTHTTGSTGDSHRLDPERNLHSDPESSHQDRRPRYHPTPTDPLAHLPTRSPFCLHQVGPVSSFPPDNVSQSPVVDIFLLRLETPRPRTVRPQPPSLQTGTEPMCVYVSVSWGHSGPSRWRL